MKLITKTALSLYILVIFLYIFFSYFISNNLYAESLNPLSGNKNDIAIGKTLFVKRCAKCHGQTANGLDNGFSNTPGLKHFKKGYNKFVDVLKNGYIRMPAWGGMGELNNIEINQLASYLESLNTNNKKWTE